MAGNYLFFCTHCSLYIESRAMRLYINYRFLCFSVQVIKVLKPEVCVLCANITIDHIPMCQLSKLYKLLENSMIENLFLL